jgi:hypothetical protein
LFLPVQKVGVGAVTIDPTKVRDEQAKAQALDKDVAKVGRQAIPDETMVSMYSYRTCILSHCWMSTLAHKMHLVLMSLLCCQLSSLNSWSELFVAGCGASQQGRLEYTHMPACLQADQFFQLLGWHHAAPPPSDQPHADITGELINR